MFIQLSFSQLPNEQNLKGVLKKYRSVKKDAIKIRLKQGLEILKWKLSLCSLMT